MMQKIAICVPPHNFCRAVSLGLHLFFLHVLVLIFCFHNLRLLFTILFLKIVHIRLLCANKYFLLTYLSNSSEFDVTAYAW